MQVYGEITGFAAIMKGQAARILSAVPKITGCASLPNSVQRLTWKTLQVHSSSRRGTCLHLLVDNHIWRTNPKSATTSAAVKFTTNYGCQQKWFSTQNFPQKHNSREEKPQNDFPRQADSETKFESRESGGETRRRGKMDRYVRRASKATEKMKEKMADTVKDLNENILTIPNLLSTTRLVMSPVLGYLVIQECYTIGACLFVVAGITDLLDGFIARNFKNQQSVLGSIIDPLADKCLVAILALSLTFSGLIPVPLTILMVSRDIGLVGSVFYLRYHSLPPPRTLSRFFDVTYATVQLKPTTISKLNTAVQLGLVGFTLAAPVFHYVDHPLLHTLWYITATTTVLSGLSYVFSKDAFKFLRK